MDKKHIKMIRGRFSYYRDLVEDLLDRIGELEMEYEELIEELHNEIDDLRDAIPIKERY